MNYLKEHYPDLDCDEQGTVFKNGIKVIPFKSNEYLQVYLRDKDNKRRILGVHTIVAMKYLDYYEGCVVHHKDKNRHNNQLCNLEVQDKIYHAHKHAVENDKFRFHNKGRVPWNKGMKMSEEFCAHCRAGAIRRHSGRK